MPIYPGRRAGSWRVTVYAHRQQHEWVVEGTKRDARRFETDKRVELRAGSQRVSRAELAFSDFCLHRYGPHAAMHLGASTWLVRRYQIDSMCECFGDARLSKVGDQVELYKAAQLAAGMKPSTVNLHLKVLRAMLRWAVSERLLDTVPAIRNLPASGKKRVRAWSRDEVNRLYACASQEMRRMLHFLLETGVRKGEAIAAKWSWVDWGERMLRIPVTDEWRPKSKRARDVPLSVALLALLRPLQQADDRPLFPTHEGGPYRKFPERGWNAMVKAAGVSGGPHTTRHTFASYFLSACPDMGLLAEILGHSQIRVTEIYAHMLPDRFARARDVVSLAPPDSPSRSARKAG